MRLQSRIQLRGNAIGRYDRLLTQDTLELIRQLHGRHAEARADLLAARADGVREFVDRPSDLDSVVVRPRGLGQVERQVTIDGGAVSASVVDVALHLVHAGGRADEVGPDVVFDLPDHHHRDEARWWADVIADARALVGRPVARIRPADPADLLVG